MALAALLWSPPGGGSPLSIRYADFLLSGTVDGCECFFRSVYELEAISQSANVNKNWFGSWLQLGCVALSESMSWLKLTLPTSSCGYGGGQM